MKPILFSTSMVQAILDGRKTQTRRIVKANIVDRFVLSDDSGNILGSYTEGMPEVYPTIDDAPYQEGDILWVRETWYYEEHMHDLTEGEPDLASGRYSHRYVYKADNRDYPVNVGVGEHGWKPSIHMPREAARIFLKVTNVRVERLQEITPHDAWNEGCRIGNSFPWEEHIPELQQQCRDILFKSLWNSINEKRGYGWDKNPWVWVYEFEKISKEEAERLEGLR